MMMPCAHVCNTIAIPTSKSSHHMIAFDILRETNRKTTVVSPRERNVILIARIRGCWVAERSSPGGGGGKLIVVNQVEDRCAGRIFERKRVRAFEMESVVQAVLFVTANAIQSVLSWLPPKRGAI